MLKLNIPLSLLFFTLFGLSTASADPTIDSVSNIFVHGEIIVITGNSFGIKNPAAPLIWDDCEEHNDGDDPVSNGGWSFRRPSSGPDAMYYRENGYLGVPATHNRSNKYVTGNMGGANARNVGLGMYTGNSAHNYVIWYYRTHPNFPGGSIDNDKFWGVSQGSDGMYNGGPYLNWRSSADDFRLMRPGLWCNYGSTGILCGQSPLDGYSTKTKEFSDNWVRLEVRAYFSRGPDGEFEVRHDNERNDYRKRWDVSGCCTWDQAAPPNSHYIGGYYNPLSLSYARRYFDDIYMDTTWARVMLGNNSNYDSCTIIEPQIPSEWSSNSITCKVNLGKLPTSGTAFIFVFDSDNNHNPVGYPITIGGGGDVDTPPIVQITSPTSRSVYNSSESFVDIGGNSSDDDRISTITWSNSRGGGGSTSNDSGDWTSWSVDNISLQEGVNAITVTVTDSIDQTSTDTIDVTYSSGASSPPGHPSGLGIVAWQAEKQTGDSNWKNSVVTYCVRLLIEGSHVNQTGSTVYLGFQGRSSGNYTIRKVSIAERDMNGNQGDVIDSTWKRVTFDGRTEATWANDMVVVQPGTLKRSNPISFGISMGKDYYVTFKIETPSVYLNPQTGYQELYFSTEDRTDYIDWSGTGFITVQDYHALSSIAILN